MNRCLGLGDPLDRFWKILRVVFGRSKICFWIFVDFWST